MLSKIFSQFPQFEKIFWNYAPFAVAQVNLRGGIDRANGKLCNLLGYTETELKELIFDDITYGTDLPKDRHQFNQLLEKKIDHYHISKRYITHSKLIFMAELYVFAVIDESESVDHVIAFVLPVTGYNSNAWGYIARDWKRLRNVGYILITIIIALIGWLFDLDILALMF